MIKNEDGYFDIWSPKTFPHPSRDAAPQWLVYSLTRRLSAECRNVEVVWMGPVMAVVMAVVLMLGLEVTVWADEDEIWQIFKKARKVVEMSPKLNHDSGESEAKKQKDKGKR
jgi:hypothetical protein